MKMIQLTVTEVQAINGGAEDAPYRLGHFLGTAARVSATLPIVVAVTAITYVVNEFSEK
jgi:hypothetical protein